MFQMMGVFAEFERAMIRERVMAGLARAREEGTKLGRRPIEEADAKKGEGLLGGFYILIAPKETTGLVLPLGQ